MVVVSGDAVADDFPQDLRTALLRCRQVLEREQGCSFTEHHAGPSRIEGTTFVRRCCLE